MSFSEFTQRDYEVIARNYAELKEAARKRCSGEQELAVVQDDDLVTDRLHLGQDVGTQDHRVFLG